MSSVRDIIDDAWRDRLALMRERAAWLEAVDPGGQDDEGGKDVMEALLAVYDGLAKWGAADPAEAETLRARVRRPELAGVLHGPRAQGTLAAYCGEGERYALRGRTDGYLQACEYRSAVASLTEDFDGVVAAPFVEEEFDGFDEELRDVADDATPVHRAQVPSWADRSSHWWWWKPDRVDMSMREYGDRVYAGDLGSVAPGDADWLRCGDEECWCFTAPA
ncbi:hypothetical protein [Actinomadura litoris]|uniref:hypothetical protein n=1 Tax=Actinomadura litoris TaxID=2678616 RepID=UPI001FA6F08A|nr:hypothetical protein [Actinomadura litoris]